MFYETTNIHLKLLKFPTRLGASLNGLLQQASSCLLAKTSPVLWWMLLFSNGLLSTERQGKAWANVLDVLSLNTTFLFKHKTAFFHIISNCLLQFGYMFSPSWFQNRCQVLILKEHVTHWWFPSLPLAPSLTQCGYGCVHTHVWFSVFIDQKVSHLILLH